MLHLQMVLFFMRILTDCNKAAHIAACVTAMFHISDSCYIFCVVHRDGHGRQCISSTLLLYKVA